MFIACSGLKDLSGILKNTKYGKGNFSSYVDNPPGVIFRLHINPLSSEGEKLQNVNLESNLEIIICPLVATPQMNLRIIRTYYANRIYLNHGGSSQSCLENPRRVDIMKAWKLKCSSIAP